MIYFLNTNTINWIKQSLEIPKWVIRIRKSKKDTHHNGKKKDKRTHNDLQNTTQKLKIDQQEHQ